MKKSLLVLTLSLVAIITYAAPYDFTAKVSSGQTLYFKVLNEAARTVAICNETGGRSTAGWVSPAYSNESKRPTGDLVIPSTISYSGKTYTITTIDTLAFYQCSGLTSVSIAEGITAINANAFEDCTKMTKATLPTTLTHLGQWVFREDKLLKVDLSKTKIQKLEEYVFLRNEVITELRLPETITEISGYALCQLPNLETIYMGSNVTEISSTYQAFTELPKLKSIYIAAATPPETSSAFPSSITSTVTLHVPEASISTYKSAYSWKGFTTILPYNVVIDDSYCRANVSINDVKMGTISINGISTSGNNSKIIIKKGEQITINAVPSSKEYTLKKLIVNGVDQTSKVMNNTYKAGTTNTDITVSAEFERTPVAVTIHILGSPVNIVINKVYGDSFAVDFKSVSTKPIKEILVNRELWLWDNYSINSLTRNMLIEITPADEIKADVNEDGNVNSVDVVSVYNYINAGK